jgi:uncharacterized protein involved in oxidation of intracellular sulfur
MILAILSSPPYNGTDVTWNALRLVSKLVDDGRNVRLFLMNDAVDLARNSTTPPATYDQDLVVMVKKLIERGVMVHVCGTCMARCGVHKNEPYYDGAVHSTMATLAEWVEEADKVLTF